MLNVAVASHYASLATAQRIAKLWMTSPRGSVGRSAEAALVAAQNSINRIKR